MNPTNAPHHPDIAAFVMAGGEGSRLRPLTATRCKPALPFGSHHRVVDFVLGNLANSGVRSTLLLVQYQAQGLSDHVNAVWASKQAASHAMTLTVVPPRADRHFRGTADAVRQNLERIEALGAEWVAVFGADHVYRMDLRQMAEAHRAADADVSVAAVPVPYRLASAFGILDTDGAGRILHFSEKPAAPRAMPGRPGCALASTGNYLFSASVLKRALREAGELGETDFGAQVLPRLVSRHRLVAYDFSQNRVGPSAPGEEAGYWRDVGTVGAYFESQLDVLGDAPRFRLHNPHWPIPAQGGASGNPPAPPDTEGADVRHSLLGDGCRIRHARLDRAVLRGGVDVDEDALITQSVVLAGCRVGRGARLHRVILDEDNDVPPRATIGLDPEADRRHFHVTATGITVVPRGFFARGGHGNA